MAVATDILALDEAQAAIGATGDQTYDGQLERAVTAISDLIETRVGPVVIRSVTDAHDGGYCSITPYQRVSEITSVVEWQGSTEVELTPETPGGQEPYAYLYDEVRRMLIRRESGFDARWYPGRLNIVLTYDAGRYATTDAVAPRFKEAAAIALAHNWRFDHGQGNQTFGAFDGEPGFGRGFALPNRALEILSNDRRVPGVA